MRAAMVKYDPKDRRYRTVGAAEIVLSCGDLDCTAYSGDLWCINMGNVCPNLSVAIRRSNMKKVDAEQEAGP